MNQQERQLVDALFERLSKLENTPRDADAMAAITQGLLRAPNAIYPLVQTVLLQDEALKRAAARIEELEGRASVPAPQGGFLDNMREAVFGQQQNHGSVPSVRPGDASRPVWNTGTVFRDAPRNTPEAQPEPRAQQGGGSFLGTAAAAAAGMIGGSLLMNSLGGLMGGNRHGLADTSSTGKGNDGGSPWTGDQSKGELARDAGIGDIGGRDAHAAGSRHGLLDQASNASHDEDDEVDFDSDDSDFGDSDFA